VFHRFELFGSGNWLDASRLGRRSCLAVITLALPITRVADAQPLVPPTGAASFYLGAEAGWTMLASRNASATIPVIGFRSDTHSWHDGFSVGARAGYAWGPLRVEEEFRYQENDAHRFAKAAASGGAEAAAFMTNVLYDIALGWPVTPHLGGGIGAVDLSDRATVAGFWTPVQGSDWVLGYQAIAGFRYNIDASLALDVDYRYLATTTPHFRTAPDFVDSGVPAGNLRVTSGYQSHSLVTSLVLRLGAP
jgi:opacity protein-like surface antigen